VCMADNYTDNDTVNSVSHPMTCGHPKEAMKEWGCLACSLLAASRNVSYSRPNRISPLVRSPSTAASITKVRLGRKEGQPICVSRGDVLRQSSCDYCALRQVKIDVRHCDIHVSCIDEFDPRYRVRGVKKCQECEHYKSPEQSSTNIPFNDNPPAIITINDTILNKQPHVMVETHTLTFNRTFAFGITTIPERRTTTLPITLKSLVNAGFHDPILFIDDRDDGGWGLEYDMVTAPLYLSLRKVYRTDGRIRAFGHWLLSLWELFIRNPHADLYALFQDDIIVSRNLRLYLDTITYPHRGYVNLYTMPSNQKIAPDNGNKLGFYRSNQNGKSATALVFDKESIVPLLTSPHLIKKLRSRNHQAWKSIDGGVIQAFRDASPVGHWHEYVHNPSLVQHIGDVSSLGNPSVESLKDPNHWKAPSFRGEDFDCMSLLPVPQPTQPLKTEG
jgi:hypothetical protein